MLAHSILHHAPLNEWLLTHINAMTNGHLEYHTILYHGILHHILPYHIILHGIILYYTILYYTILYYTILYWTRLDYTILYYTLLYYTIPCCPILYYTILYSSLLYSTILYYPLLYYTILHSTIPQYTRYILHIMTSHLEPLRDGAVVQAVGERSVHEAPIYVDIFGGRERHILQICMYVILLYVYIHAS